MSRVFAALIRHGDYHQLPETPSAHQPFALNSEGEGQAIQGAEVLRRDAAANDWTIDTVIDSSRLLRGWQTATLIAESLGTAASNAFSVAGFDDLAERGLGSAANLSVGRIEEILDQDPRFERPPRDWKSNSRYRLPLQGAESLLEAGSRVAAHLESRMRAVQDLASRDTLKIFVGHGAAFRHAAYHLGVLSYEQISALSMYHVQPVYLEYQGVAQWRHVQGDWKVRQSIAEPLD